MPLKNNDPKEQSGTDVPLSYPEFSPPTYEEWREVAVASLKGAPFEKKVITKTYEEIELQPIYWRQDIQKLSQLSSLPGTPPFVRGTTDGGYVESPWAVCQEIWAPTPEEFNSVIRHDLARGQTALGVVLDGPSMSGLDVDRADAEEVGSKGLSVCSLKDLEAAFDGVQLSTTPLHIGAGATALPLVASFAALAQSKGGSPADLKGCVGADPLGALSRAGSLNMPLEGAYDTMAGLVHWSTGEAPELKTVMVQGCPYHEAGGSATQELGFAVATGVEYIRALLDRGVEVDAAASSLCFTFSLGANFFMEIAKLRAARLLWTRVVESFGGSVEAQKMYIHGRTSAWTKTVFDPYVNMLRNTTEAFSGVVGGVDSLHVRPFDEHIRPPDEFSRRVSRNVQLLLQLESHLTHPVDPAGGSWYVESLTDQVAQEAWTIFQEVERRGGMSKALTESYPQQETARVAGMRASNLATRKNVIIGTNLYADPAETLLEAPPSDREALLETRRAVVDALRESAGDEGARLIAELDGVSFAEAETVDAVAAAVAAGTTLGDISALIAGQGQELPSIQPLKIGRASLPYEQLRQSVEGAGQERGRRLQVFLANIGPIPQHKPRADFSRRFFEVGGFEVLRNDGFATAKEAAEAALASEADVVVICSTDKVYPEVVPELTRHIKEARPEIKVILAGKPAPEAEKAYTEAGLDTFIFIKSNCLELLESLVPTSKEVSHG